MRRVGAYFAPSGVSVDSAMDEAITQADGDVGLRVMQRAKMIAGDIEAAPVELADPALDRNLPVGMAIIEGANDADADRLAQRRRRRQRRRQIVTRDNARYHLAIDLLQRAVVAALIGQQERMPCTDRLDRVALQYAGIDVYAQRVQFLLVGHALTRNFTFFGIGHRQFGKTGGKARFGMVRP